MLGAAAACVPSQAANRHGALAAESRAADALRCAALCGPLVQAVDVTLMPGYPKLLDDEAA